MSTTEAQAKTKRSRWLWALIVFGVFACGSCFVLGGLAFAAARTPEGQRALNAVGKARSASKRGEHLPGAEELRDAGCLQAAVFDANEMLEVGEPFMGDAGHLKESFSIVSCEVGLLAEPPSCDRLATVYAGAAHPATFFLLMVTKLARPVCKRSYDANGAMLDDQLRARPPSR